MQLVAWLYIRVFEAHTVIHDEVTHIEKHVKDKRALLYIGQYKQRTDVKFQINLSMNCFNNIIQKGRYRS